MKGIRSACSVGFLAFVCATTASGQSFNVDLGDFSGTPPDTYAAAGVAGVWNTLNIESASLVDINGAASGVSLAVSAEALTSGPGTPPDQTLLGDNIFDCNGTLEWSLAFTGLANGSYDVLVYAPSHTGIDTGNMLVNGVAVAPLLGASALQEGVSHRSVAVSVIGGTLDISGLGGTSGLCAGLAGVQIEGPGPIALNVDVGPTDHLPPPSDYSAAGIAGTWNALSFGSASLVNADGSPSAVSMTVDSESANSGGPGSPPDSLLLGDAIFDCDGIPRWSLAFAGLSNGLYRVLVYAPSNDALYTGDLLVNGVSATPVDGASSIQPGASHTGVVVGVSDGTLDISGTGNDSVRCAGVAGAQIDGPVIPGFVSLNVDLGASTQASPPSSYAAAGTAGTWNGVSIGSAALVDSDASSSSVSMTANAESLGTGPGQSPEVDLLGDYISDCNGVREWSVSFSGLVDGGYRIRLYAPSNTVIETGDMLVNGKTVPTLLGASTLQDGVSHTSVIAAVSGGALDISGVSNTPGLCAGLAGVQLEGPLSGTIPALTTGGCATLLVLLFLCGVLVFGRRRGFGARG